MATKYWRGTADAVAQISTVEISAYDATTTYKLTLGDLVISVLGTTDADGTAAALATAWNDSTHPYCTGVTASNATDTVTLTADTAGVPFVATSSVSGGAGTIGSVTESTASAGPCDWSTADNWSDGAIPANGDTVIFRDSAVSCCFGLDNNSLTLVELRVEQTYTGKIGFNRNQFVTSADGDAADTSKSEYRDDYLRVDVDTIEIGKHVGSGSASGSGRIKISNESTDAATITVFATSSVATESRLAPVRFKTAHANTDIYIRSGSVGLGIDEPEENCTVGDIFLNGSNSKLYMGSAASVENLVQSDGQSLVQSDATVTSIKLLGGNMTTEGDYTVTTFTIEGGVLNPNHGKSGGNAITTFNINGGVVQGNQTSAPRTWATVNVAVGASLTLDPNQVTMTTYNDPADEYTVTYS